MSDLSNPITRIENYLAGIAGVLGAIPNQPVTRIEEYLEAIYNSVPKIEYLEYTLPEGCTDINSCVARLGDIVFIIIDYAFPPSLTSFENRAELLRVPAFNGKHIKTHFGCGIFNNYTPESDPSKYGDDGSAKSCTCLWQASTNKFVTSSGQSGITNGRISGAGLVKFPEN